MLPFLKPKAVAGLIISKRKPDAEAPIQESHSEENEDQGLEMAMEDLIRAIHAKDAKAACAAFKAAQEISDSEPDQGDDYDSRNEAAAQEENE